MPAPVLLLGFNRPGKLETLILSLRETRPKIVRIALDGPRSHHPQDVALVNECNEVVRLIDWTDDVVVRRREENMGLEHAIPDAVSWVLSEFRSVIVIEDDVIVGPQFIEFANEMLTRFEKDDSVMHISGYNAVPIDSITNKDRSVRSSRIPESYAWATWKSSWEAYNPSISPALTMPTKSLMEVTGSWLAAIRWRQNFILADRRLISTWAYRWLASIWSNNGYCISPNRNLVKYNGYTGGTHTRRKARWKELPVEYLDYQKDMIEVDFDSKADRFLNTTVFNATLVGTLLGPAERLAMQGLRVFEELRVGKK